MVSLKQVSLFYFISVIIPRDSECPVIHFFYLEQWMAIKEGPSFEMEMCMLKNARLSRRI